MPDFRIDVGFFGHIKTKKLRRKLGLDGVFALQMLWAYAAQHEHDGCKIYTAEDIALAVDWDGDDLAQVLAEVGYLDEADGGYSIHEWESHNGYAASASKRTEAARLAANKRWESKRKCDGNADASDSQCDGNADAMPSDANGNAPSPSPSPSPSPEPDPAPHAQDAGVRVDSLPADSKPKFAPGPAPSEYSVEFLELAEQYPRKGEGLAAAWIAFKQCKAAHAYPGNPIVQPILVQWRISPQWTDDGGRFVPNFSRWIRERRWEAGPPEDEKAKVAKQVADMMAIRDMKKAGGMRQ